ncbi:hypothetical protein TrVE_jg10175 [Triparma verrucosa]|uniref:Uncharacterized protein n=2 Tax=Triparma TaxID=722752 RepID=A0A9W7DSW8_9STRA|nr:hypothetical protein TrST_g11889 [Triparma strigata]GMH84876.1 hypothetical protein TrVE_jg10175 [Triparma verrucosa]
MAQGNLVKKSSLKRKPASRKPAKRSRENKKGAVSRTGKGSKAVRNKYSDIKNTTRVIDAKNLATAAAKATMSGGGRFFLGDVEKVGKSEEKKLRMEKEKKTDGSGRLTNRIDKSLRKMGGKSSAFK